MEDLRFDLWSRRLARVAIPRRLALPRLAAALGVLTSFLPRDEVEAACRRGTKRCGKRCVPVRACCTDADCRARSRGTRCWQGRCCHGTSRSLRAALRPGGPATIRLCPNTAYSGPFRITRNLTVIGAGAPSTVLTGGGTHRVIVVDDRVTTATIRGVQIQDGRADWVGGGILNRGTLSLTSCTVTNTRRGAGIYNEGTLSLSRCNVTDNQGVGIENWGEMTLSTSSITNNRRGGIQSGNTTTRRASAALSASTVARNHATFHGGGIFNVGGTVTLRNGSSVVDNMTDESGGGIFNISGGTILLQDTVVAGNRAANFGGGIFNASAGHASRLTLSGASLVTDNDANPDDPESGGGIHNIDLVSGGAFVELLDASQVISNRPNECTPATICPA